jgi:small multidrug resistance pump
MMYAMTTGCYFLLAILLEVAGITSMKLSEGFSYVGPSVLIFIFYGFSFIFLALSLKRMEVSIAYAMWSGIGTLLIAVIGIFFFHEHVTLIKIMSLGLIVLGVFGLRLAEPSGKFQ